MMVAGRCLVLAAAWLVPLAGCSDMGNDAAQPSGGSEEVSFSADVQPIFSASCAISDCHSGEFPAADMNLSAGQSHAALVNVPALQRPDLERVLAGEPDSSYLYHRLTAAQGATVMPPGSPLPAGQIATIRQWIEEGAKGN
jgi:hypothetical protein